MTHYKVRKSEIPQKHVWLLEEMTDKPDGTRGINRRMRPVRGSRAETDVAAVLDELDQRVVRSDLELLLCGAFAPSVTRLGTPPQPKSKWRMKKKTDACLSCVSSSAAQSSSLSETDGTKVQEGARGGHAAAAIAPGLRARRALRLRQGGLA